MNSVRLVCDGVQGKWKRKEEKCRGGDTVDQEEVQLSGLWTGR